MLSSQYFKKYILKLFLIKLYFCLLSKLVLDPSNLSDHVKLMTT